MDDLNLSVCISGVWVNKLRSYREWFLKQEKLMSDESKRPREQPNSSDMFGFDGSFRQLSIDWNLNSDVCPELSQIRSHFYVLFFNMERFFRFSTMLQHFKVPIAMLPYYFFYRLWNLRIRIMLSAASWCYFIKN